MQLTGKVIITGQIHTMTGLHIGGSKASLDIGGLDLNVIKTPGEVPYIPGSSLKGKLRSLLARVAGTVAVADRDANGGPSDESAPNAEHIREIFGLPGDETVGTKANKKGIVTRLVVRDADLHVEEFKKNFRDGSMEFPFSDIKWENTINRRTGTAEHPRQLERVPAGVRFDFEMVYDVYGDNKKDGHLGHILAAMRMLEADYIGGQGSRGYGKIKFKKVKFVEKSVDDFAKEGATGSELTKFQI